MTIIRPGLGAHSSPQKKSLPVFMSALASMTQGRAAAMGSSSRFIVALSWALAFCLSAFGAAFHAAAFGCWSVFGVSMSCTVPTRQHKVTQRETRLLRAVVLHFLPRNWPPRSRQFACST